MTTQSANRDVTARSAPITFPFAFGGCSPVGAGDSCERYLSTHGGIVLSARSSVTVARTLVALAAVASIVAPANPRAQAQDSPASNSDQLRQNSAQVDIDIDPLRVENTEVEAALGDIAANVEAQTEQLTAAQTALAEADAAVAEADAAVAETQGRLDALSAETDRVVIDAFINPPAESALDAFSAATLTDMSVKQSILNQKATSDAETLGMYQEANAQLDAQMAEREELAAQAEQRRSTAETALANLESALSQQALFAVEVEARIDQRLAEAASIEQFDPALAEQIRAREAALAGTLSTMQAEAQAQAAQEQAAQLAAIAEAAKGYGTIKDPPGGLASVPCPAGGEIQVAGDISGPVGRLLEDAAAAGVTMCGGGFRDPQEQIQLRRQNCGSSDYAIYRAPSSSCSPPTARPGSSLHEQGLAIDFTCGGDSTVRSGDACHDWLRANAADYGLYNLPSEPWHWSVDGN
jgi:LAS superfamily LD-carboxypeptidase LdcB